MTSFIWGVISTNHQIFEQILKTKNYLIKGWGNYISY